MVLSIGDMTLERSFRSELACALAAIIWSRPAALRAAVTRSAFRGPVAYVVSGALAHARYLRSRGQWATASDLLFCEPGPEKVAQTGKSPGQTTWASGP